MPERSCQAVQHWLARQGAATSHGALPTPDLVAHAATCPACRGLLMTTAVTFLNASAPPASIVCSECEHDLDAFIDWEERYDLAAAAQRYPQIWWHVLNCGACAEVYAGVHALLRAEATGKLMAMPLPQLYPVLQLPRTYLHAALAPQLALGVGWGADDAQQIAEATLGSFQFALAAYPNNDTTVTLMVQLDPPAPGAIELRLDPLFVRVPLAADGTAFVRDVPAAMLTARAGADLCLDLELDEPFE